MLFLPYKFNKESSIGSVKENCIQVHNNVCMYVCMSVMYVRMYSNTRISSI